MSFLLLLGIFAFLAVAVFLGYLGYKAVRKTSEEPHPPGPPAHSPPQAKDRPADTVDVQ